jgi:hypothetical protein
MQGTLPIDIIFICATLSVTTIVANYSSKGNSLEGTNALQHLHCDSGDAECRGLHQ